MSDKQLIEFNHMNEILSDHLVTGLNAQTRFHSLNKTTNGYSFRRICNAKSDCNVIWTLKLNVLTNECIILRKNECKHY